MKKLFKYLKPYKGYAILSPLLMMGEVLADLCLPYLMSFIVNYGIIGEDLRENGVAYFVMRLLFGDVSYSSLQIIITFGILMLLIVMVGGFFGTFCAYTAAKAAQGWRSSRVRRGKLSPISAATPWRVSAKRLHCAANRVNGITRKPMAARRLRAVRWTKSPA